MTRCSFLLLQVHNLTKFIPLECLHHSLCVYVEFSTEIGGSEELLDTGHPLKFVPSVIVVLKLGRELLINISAHLPDEDTFVSV